jgi:hypothetical protein
VIPLPPVAVPGGLGTVGIGLLVALVAGVFAGWTNRRLFYLVVGIVVVAVVGIGVTATNLPPSAAQPERVGALYGVSIPLLVAFVAGWLCARGSWFTRVLVIILAVVVLAVFPYGAATTATAAVIPGG